MSCLPCEAMVSLVLAAAVTWVSAAERFDTFTVVEALADKVCPAERLLQEVNAISHLSCMATAARWGDCTGVSYHDNSNMCYVCDTYEDLPTGSFTTLAGATFYHRSNGTALPDGFTDVAGYALKIVNNVGFTYDQASSDCASNGALLKIDTADKMAAISAFLKDPANGFTGGSFWVQLHKPDGDGVWKYADGSPVPMTPDFWASGQPQSPSHECGYIKMLHDFLWGNQNCVMGIGYICELI